MTTQTRTVYLDHHIPKDSVYYIAPSKTYQSQEDKKYQEVRYSDILNDDEFTAYRKPDFQRPTNDWTPDQCVKFLESIVNKWTVPNIILWKNPHNGLIYVLDGAHRLSVIRAWLTGDWGDGERAKDHYVYDLELIKEIAQETKMLVEEKIGSFERFEAAAKDMKTARKDMMSDAEIAMADFYKVIKGTGILDVQWATDDYEQAEQSFLRINLGGQTLNKTEQTLITNRRGSYTRAIMAIAGNGSGDYWPYVEEDNNLNQMVSTFGKKARLIHNRLFEPSLKLPLTDVNQPFIVSPPYFEKHRYLGEILPILADGKIHRTEEAQESILASDKDAPAKIVIQNGERILASALDKINHLIGPNNQPKALNIVPLFYWYSLRAKFLRALCYGFTYWMLYGSEGDIRQRKVIFCGNRDRFEYILHRLKPKIATIHEAGGAGLLSAEKAAIFFQKLLKLLHSKPSVSPEKLESEVIDILIKLRARLGIEKKHLESNRRSASGSSIAIHVDINDYFKGWIRCPICSGIFNTERGKQYDHSILGYAESGITRPQDLGNTHPFCNHAKRDIESYKNNPKNYALPKFDIDVDKKEEKEPKYVQGNLNLFGEGLFPSESYEELSE